LPAPIRCGARLRGADIVSAPINAPLEASNDPDVVADGYVTHVDHPKHGRLKVHGVPWQFSETPARSGIAPELGEHNAAVLGGPGYWHRGDRRSPRAQGHLESPNLWDRDHRLFG